MTAAAVGLAQRKIWASAQFDKPAGGTAIVVFHPPASQQHHADVITLFSAEEVEWHSQYFTCLLSPERSTAVSGGTEFAAGTDNQP